MIYKPRLTNTSTLIDTKELTLIKTLYSFAGIEAYKKDNTLVSIRVYQPSSIKLRLSEYVSTLGYSILSSGIVSKEKPTLILDNNLTLSKDTFDNIDINKTILLDITELTDKNAEKLYNNIQTNFNYIIDNKSRLINHIVAQLHKNGLNSIPEYIIHDFNTYLSKSNLIKKYNTEKLIHSIVFNYDYKPHLSIESLEIANDNFLTNLLSLNLVLSTLYDKSCLTILDNINTVISEYTKNYKQYGREYALKQNYKEI